MRFPGNLNSARQRIMYVKYFVQGYRGGGDPVQYGGGDSLRSGAKHRDRVHPLLPRRRHDGRDYVQARARPGPHRSQLARPREERHRELVSWTLIVEFKIKQRLVILYK